MAERSAGSGVAADGAAARMIYTIKAHPTLYRRTMFRSRLEARWAAFFDLVGWEWEYEPIDLEGWTPDFRVIIPCGHSECNGHHTLLVEVKPYYSLDQFADHQVALYRLQHPWDEPVGAMFGINPSITEWEMIHGAGGGIESVSGWADCDLWEDAGNLTQWMPV